MVDSFTSFFNW